LGVRAECSKADQDGGEEADAEGKSAEHVHFSNEGGRREFLTDGRKDERKVDSVSGWPVRAHCSDFFLAIGMTGGRAETARRE
jgi:hypothetical protein